MKRNAISLLIIILLISICPFFVSCKKSNNYQVIEYEDCVYHWNLSYGDDDRHKLDLAIPKGNQEINGLILMIHGGAWVSGNKDIYSQDLKKWSLNGYVTSAINYRYASPKIDVNDIMNDITLALLKIKEVALQQNINLTKVLLTGGSAGAHLALMYGYAKADIAPIEPVAVVSYSGPTDLTDKTYFENEKYKDLYDWISKISGYRFEKLEEYDLALPFLKQASPIHYVTEKTIPTLICHGLNDDLVSYSNAINLKNELDKKGVTNHLISFNSGHGLDGDSIAFQEAERLLNEYITTYLN